MVKWASHRAGDYLATLANAKFVKFPKSSPKIPQSPTFFSFDKCALVFAERSLKILKICSRDYSGKLTFDPKSQSFAVFP